MLANSTLLNVSYLTTYVLLSIGGLTLVKMSQSIISIRFFSGLILYCLGFIIWIFLILRVMPLSRAFPLAAGALIIGSQLSGWFVLKEELGTKPSFFYFFD